MLTRIIGHEIPSVMFDPFPFWSLIPFGFNHLSRTAPIPIHRREIVIREKQSERSSSKMVEKLEEWGEETEEEARGRLWLANDGSVSSWEAELAKCRDEKSNCCCRENWPKWSIKIRSWTWPNYFGDNLGINNLTKMFFWNTYIEFEFLTCAIY